MPTGRPGELCRYR